MTDTKNTKPSPIEVWLRQDNMEINCMVVHEDETTDDKVFIDSLSMRGAQREITGYYLSEGYVPVGRWESTVESRDGEFETVRRFKLA